jgi:hypothetical protein
MAEPIVLSEIKNIDDLKKILKFLSDQGFNVSESGYNLNEYKINRIIDRANVLDVTIPRRDDLYSELSKLGNYSDMINAANKYFSKFSSKDKIKEYINTFYVQEDDIGKVASHNSPSTKEIIEWFNFKTKYNLNDDFSGNIYYYNLDKNILKIRFGNNNNSDFERFYKLVYNEDCNELTTAIYGKKIGPGQVDYNKYGVWQNLGKIEIKFLQNGNANLKGDLTDIREYNYQHLIDRTYGTHMIKYKGETEFVKSKKEVY